MILEGWSFSPTGFTYTFKGPRGYEYVNCPALFLLAVLVGGP